MLDSFTVTISRDGPIVLVDDNPGDELIVRRSYERSKLDNPWIAFRSGPEFLTHLQEVRAGRQPMPGLVLLDINMPEMSGLDVLARVRDDPDFRELPVFCMLTSSTDPRDRQRAEARGASGFVVKPNDPADYVAFFDALARSG